MKTKIQFAVLTLLAAAVCAFHGGSSKADPPHPAATKIRWDLVSLISFSPVTAVTGGHDSALANDGSEVTLTGSGTFVFTPTNQPIAAVTGGGTWQTFAPDRVTSTGSGTYVVDRLVRFSPAPGVQTSTLVDEIGNGTLADNRAGLAVFDIEYSDGSRGILAVSCHLNGNPPPQGPDASPASIFEGVTASKGFVDYWNRVPPVPGVDANRTIFHVISE
jgi:hypothetical protein